MIRSITFERFLLVALLAVTTLLCIVAITYVRESRAPLRNAEADLAVTARAHDTHYSVVSVRNARSEKPGPIIPITPPNHGDDEGPSQNSDDECRNGNWDPICTYQRLAICGAIKTFITVVLCLFGLLC